MLLSLEREDQAGFRHSAARWPSGGKQRPLEEVPGTYQASERKKLKGSGCLLPGRFQVPGPSGRRGPWRPQRCGAHRDSRPLPRPSRLSSTCQAAPWPPQVCRCLFPAACFSHFPTGPPSSEPPWLRRKQGSDHGLLHPLFPPGPPSFSPSLGPRACVSQAFSEGSPALPPWDLGGVCMAPPPHSFIPLFKYHLSVGPLTTQVNPQPPHPHLPSLSYLAP